MDGRIVRGVRVGMVLVYFALLLNFLSLVQSLPRFSYKIQLGE